MAKSNNRNLTDKIGSIASQSRSSSSSFSKRPDLAVVNSSVGSKNLSTHVDRSPEKLSIDPRHELGVNSEAPEIISFFDFIPVYDDQGNLNDAGNYFQIKQDSILTSARDSITSTVALETIDVIRELASYNRQEIKKNSDYFGNKIHDLLNDLIVITKRFDCRNVFSKSDFEYLKKINIFEDFMHTPAGVLANFSEAQKISKWTSTKTWIQLCLSLKNYIKTNGIHGGSLYIPVSNVTENPYLIEPPAEQKGSFNEKFNRSLVRDVTVSLQDIEDLNSLIDSSSRIYSDLISEKILDNSTQDYLSFSKLVYHFAREVAISWSFKNEANMKDALSRFNYSPLKNNKYNSYDIWDIFIGKKVPKDITDFPVAASNGGKSLLDICQLRESDGDVLTFEDLFIKDDVGSAGANPVKIPGTYYFAEDLLDTTTFKFNTAKIKKLLERLELSIVSLRAMNSMVPLSDPLMGIGGSGDPTEMTTYHSAPGLMALIENKVFSGTELERQMFISKSEEYKKYVEDVKKRDKEKDTISKLKDEIAAKQSQFDKDKQIYDLAVIEVPSAIKVASHKSGSDQFATYFGIYPNDEDGHKAAYNDFIKFQAGVEAEGKALEELKSKLEEEELTLQSENVDIKTDENKLPQDVSHLLISAAIEQLYEGDSELFSCLFAHVSMMGLNDANSSFTQSIALRISYKIEQIVKAAALTKELWGKPFADIPTEKIYDSLSDFSDEGTLKLLKNMGKTLKTVHDTLKSEGMFETVTFPGAPSQNFSDRDITAYSGIQKSSLYLLMFLMMCFSVHMINPERIVGFSSSSTSEIHKDSYIIQIISDESLAKDKLRYKKFIKPECQKFIRNLNKEHYKVVNFFIAFLSILRIRLDNYKDSLEKGDYHTLITQLGDIIENPKQVKKILSKEQLSLITCGLFESSRRSAEDYSSPLKGIDPYFTDLSDSRDVELFSPIQDANLISWNLLLTKFLKLESYRSALAFNKKIMSVGIPAGLQRTLQVDESKLSGRIRNGIVKINLYREDCLHPDIHHTPLSFLFDMNRFPARNLSFFPDISKYDDPSDFFWNLPSLELNSSTGDIKIANGISNSFGKSMDSSSLSLFPNSEYSFLNELELLKIFSNHAISHILEEYLNFVSHISFDEQKFYKYLPLKKEKESQRAKFMAQIDKRYRQIRNAISFTPSPQGSTSVQTGTYLVMETKPIEQSLVTPRKFDRVFHVVFDPDDFYVDTEKTSLATISYFEKKGILEKNIIGWKRTNTLPNDSTFDKYYVALESYDDSVTTPTYSTVNKKTR